MKVRTLVRRAARFQASRSWRDVRPGGRTDLSHRAASPVALAERPPGKDEAWLPATQASGPWAHIDPLVADSWHSKTAALVNIAVWAYIGVRVQRAVKQLGLAGAADGGANVAVDGD